MLDGRCVQFRIEATVAVVRMDRHLGGARDERWCLRSGYVPRRREPPPHTDQTVGMHRNHHERVLRKGIPAVLPVEVLAIHGRRPTEHG